jgi:predicted ATP-dependent endonuclease of OLD family
MQADQLEIRVWFIDPITEREDLAIALSQCGTGVGQVLAILYILITSQEPRIIIIDEPQSFLHPGAAKKLIEILREFPQHQYFISTHSPEIISSANPSKIVKLQYEDCETKASLIDSRETAEQRSLLAEIGVRLSDVFGADNILWVEGPTEERCLPLILNNLAKKPLRGTQIQPSKYG